jgi:GNAT superfamily N-acetyltransferase
MVMEIIEIKDDEKKKEISRTILESLTEWFEVTESREGYISDSPGKIFFAAYDGEKLVGFLYLKETGDATMELAVMGVLKEFHSQGVGRKLFESARKAAADAGYSFIQVKTVKMGMYEDYDRTNRAYIAWGFKEFEVFPEYWDAANPCQIYVMAL